MGLLPGLTGRRPSPGFTEKNLVEQVLLPGSAMPATRLDGLTHALLSPKPPLPCWLLPGLDARGPLLSVRCLMLLVCFVNLHSVTSSRYIHPELQPRAVRKNKALLKNAKDSPAILALVS